MPRNQACCPRPTPAASREGLGVSKPTSVEFMDSILRTTAGKVNTKALRTLAGGDATRRVR